MEERLLVRRPPRSEPRLRTRGLGDGTALAKPLTRTGRWCEAGCRSPRARISPEPQPCRLYRRSRNFCAGHASPRSPEGFGSSGLARRRLVERGERPP